MSPRAMTVSRWELGGLELLPAPYLLTRPERCVLIVEDDAMSREIMATVLEEAGYAVTTASDGRDAFAKLRHQFVEVIVLDMAMPIMDGWAFLASKARIPIVAPIPVVVVSGTESPCSPKGIVAWLEKPIPFDSLLRSLRLWLQAGVGRV